MASSASSETVFEKFLLEEYSNIAQAHFAAGTTITQFFQYYLLVLGVPLTAVGVVEKIAGDSTQALLGLVQSRLAPAFGAFFFIVGAVGVCMAVYIINLRIDALYYAQAVNGVRKYFLETAKARGNLARYIRLSADMNVPPYFEPTFFLAVVMAFALLDGTYLALGGAIFGLRNSSSVALIFALSILIHVTLYWWLARLGRDALGKANANTETTQEGEIEEGN